MTGARNETSVLFTLDQLTKPKAKPAPKTEKIDAEALLAPSPSLVVDEQGPPSVARIGGGGLFPTAAMAAPDFTAPAAPSAPSHPPPSSTAHAAPAQERAGGSSTLWIVLGALGVIGAGAASYFFMVRAPETPSPEPTASPEVPAATAATPSSANVEAPGAHADTTAATPSAVASAGAPASAAPPAPATGAPVATGAPAPVATGTPTAATAPTGAPTAAQMKPAPTAQTAQPKPQASAAPEPVAAEGPPFDKEAAAAALGAAAAAAQGQCASQEGPHGSGKVTVTFVNSGRATNALVSGDFAGSALGGCVAKVFRGAKVPTFGGDSVRVTKGVQIP